MRKILTFIFTVLSLIGEAATYYISPSGSDGNSGTIGSPFFSFNKAWTVMAAGDILECRGGTYNFVEQQDITSLSGSAGNLITVRGYQAEWPVFTQHVTSYPSGGQDLFIFAGSYFLFQNFEISNCTQTSADWAAFRTEGCSNVTFEHIVYDGNQLGFTVRECNNVTFNNCDFSRTQDAAGDNADGLNITYITNTGYTNYVNNCRAWLNSDDGFDTWSNQGTVIFTGCWSWKNGYATDGTTERGDGSGFKLGELGGTQTSSLRRQYIQCVAALNKLWGWNENNCLARIELINCTAYNTGDGLENQGNFILGYWDPFDAPNYLKNCISYVDAFTLNSSNTFLTTNSWTEATVTDADFESVDWTQLDDARQSNGSLPVITFMHLASGSDLVDTGTDVGLPYDGAAPDIGAFEKAEAGGSSGPPVLKKRKVIL